MIISVDGSIEMLFSGSESVFSFHYEMNLLKRSAIIIFGFKNAPVFECFGLFLIEWLKVLIPFLSLCVIIVTCICC